MKMPFLPGLLAIGALSACSVVGPDFKRPTMPLAERYATYHGDALSQAANDQWWLTMGDPLLNTLVDRALAQNLDVQIAVSRILQARALVGTTGNAALLTGNLQGQVDRVGFDGGIRQTRDIAQINPSFVVDLFGGEKRRREQAQANLTAAKFDAAAARLAVQQAVVTTYLDLRYFERALAIQSQAVKNRQRLANVVSERSRLGEATRFDLKRAQAEVASAQADLPDLKSARDVSAMQLATLLAAPGQDILAAVSATTYGQPKTHGDVAPSVPAALLQNRPDIRAAEARMAAAVARVGIAAVDLYPSLRINGNITASTVNSVSIGPALSVPLFDRAVRKARVKAAKADALEAELFWRRSVVNAVEEVQTGLIRIKQIDNRVARLKKAVSIYAEASRLTREAFDLGSVTVIELLNTQNSQTSSQLQLASARRDKAIAWAQLNVAIGQGWQHRATTDCCVITDDSTYVTQ